MGKGSRTRRWCARCWPLCREREVGQGCEGYRPEGLPGRTYGMQADGLYKLSDDRAAGNPADAPAAPHRARAGQDRRGIPRGDGSDRRPAGILAKQARITTIISDELNRIRNRSSAERTQKREIEVNALDLGDRGPDRAAGHGGHVLARRLRQVAAACRLPGAAARRPRQAGDADQRKTTGVDQLFIANTHDYILASRRGRVYWLKVCEVPQGSRGLRGRPIVNMCPLLPGERSTSCCRSRPSQRRASTSSWRRRRGLVKKTRLDRFSNRRKAGIIAVGLDEGDYLIGVALTDGRHDA